jgi:DNA uptake protein ComE-like DNA-binding protein
MRISAVFVLTLYLLLPCASFSQSTNVEFRIITPVTDKAGQAVFQNSGSGERYPVVREAGDSDLIRHAQAVLASGMPQEALKLDRFARNLLITQSDPTSSLDQELKAPMYLLLSEEEGGFARHGFWLESADGKRELVMVQYVDLAVNEAGVEDGTLEEIFPHELAHLILRSFFGERFAGPSVKMHQSMSVTDYQTAFDEGYAEHFQPLVRDNTHNRHLQALTWGKGALDRDLFWLSRVDQQLRTDGIKRNLFVHRKTIPASALDDGDRYLIFTDSETSPDFLHDELKSGQEMMASEGVISTLFYRIVNDDRLRSGYRDAGFYQSFFPSGLPPDIRTAVTPYENVNLKLFAAMRQVALRASLEGPPMIAIVDQYAKLFPNEAKAIYDDFLSTTYCATVSQETVTAFERALKSGRRGDPQAFRADSKAAFAASSNSEKLVESTLPLGANVGPELWLLNSEFKIAGAYWQKDRTQPLTINLNTATEGELMTISDINLSLARRIVTERRNRGFFESVDDLQPISGISPALFERLRGMVAAMRGTRNIVRP